ncbi:MAG: hypothetical protein ACOX9R_14415 [Armatimonadota bacterium]|jgi:neutral ceramidase
MPEGPINTDGLPAIRAGSARLDITPPLGTALAGYFVPRVSDRVEDSLYAKALVFESGGERIALVSCDVIVMPADIADPARALVEERTGIPAANVLICATHTHTGPEMRRGRIIPTNDEWLDGVPELIAEVVERACDDMFDAVLIPGSKCEDRLGSNRLGRMPDGSEVFGKEGTLGPAGPIDPELLALSVRDHSGTVRAMIVNYAMHADTVGGNGISAGWPGRLSLALRDVYGDQCVTVFLQGTCGDINHGHWRPSRWVGKGIEKAAQMGRGAAGLAVNATELGEPLETGRIGCIFRHIPIPYYTRDDQMRAEVEEKRAMEERPGRWDYIIERFDEWDLDGEIAQVPVQVMQVGEVMIVGIPSEVFVEWGLEIKHWSPAEWTFVAELANDWFGYIPTTDQAHRGAYGALPILSRRLEADGGRKMTDAVQVAMSEVWEE